MDDAQSVIISCIACATGVLSVLGSSSIVYMILSDRERKLGQPYHRIMLMMSCFDVFQSLAIVGTPFLQLEDGVGNSRICTAQGFLVALGFAVPLYNSGLNIFYMLTIRYSYSSEQFARYEPAVHATSIIVPLSLASLFAAKGHMRRRILVCIPQSKLAFRVVAVLYITNFFICISTMLSICCKVIFQTTRMSQYTYDRRTPTNRSNRITEMRNETIKQAILYFSAFMMTHTFPSIVSIMVQLREEAQLPFAVVLLAAIFYPLQGFWNFCFYIRPAVSFVTRTNPNMSFFRAVHGIIFDRTMDIGGARARRPPRNNLGVMNVSNVQNQSHIGSARAQRQSPSLLRTQTAPRNNLGETNDSNVQNQSHDNNASSIVTSISAATSQVEADSVPNEEDIVEVSSFDGATPCAPHESLQNQIESVSKNNARVRHHPSLVDVGSARNNEDTLEVSSLDDSSTRQHDGDRGKHIKFENKNKRRNRRLSLVDLGSVLNNDDFGELDSLDSI